MRLSPAELLVALAFVVPMVTQSRTVLAFFGINVTLAQSVLLGLAAGALVVLWALLPDGEAAAESDSTNEFDGH